MNRNATYLILAVSIVVGGMCGSQAGLLAQQQNEQSLKPKLSVAEIGYCLQLMERVELSGEEVNAFLEVRTVFANLIEKAQADGKQPTDMIVAELSVPIAQNFLAFMRRTKLTGSEATQFQRIMNAIIDSAPKDPNAK